MTYEIKQFIIIPCMTSGCVSCWRVEFRLIQQASASLSQVSFVTVSGEILLFPVNSHSIAERVTSLQTQAREFSSWSASVSCCWDSYIVIFSADKTVIIIWVLKVIS